MELITVQNAAERAGVTVKAIYYSLNHGKLTRHLQYGKVLVDVSEIEKYRPRAHANRSASPERNVLTGRGFLSGCRGSVDEFIARKSQEKATEQ